MKFLALAALALSSVVTSYAGTPASTDFTGKWYVISSAMIPFQDGCVEFTPDGKMITTWSGESKTADVVVNHFKFIQPDILEYSSNLPQATYRMKVSRSEGWLTLKSENKPVYLVLDRKPRGS